MVQYAGDDTAFPADFTIADDAVPPTAAVFNVGLEALGDRTAYLRARLGAIPALTFHNDVPTTESLNVLKYSDALKRWFACASSPTEYIVSTQQILVWPAVSEATAFAAASVWDFDIDSAGNLLAVDQAIDNIRKRTAAGVWSAPASEGNTTAEPNILWEPVSGNWILAYSTGAVIWVQTSGDIWATRTTRTAPTFPGAARVTLGHDGAGRVVMQGFSGTNTYFSYSDDGGVTWSAPTTHALGFTYSTAGTRHHPRPVFNGQAWVAVGMNNSTGVSQVFTSADGVTWATGVALASAAIANIAALGGIVVGCTFAATADLTGGVVFSIDDGATWRTAEGTFKFSGVSPRGIANTASRFVLLANDRIFPGVGFFAGGDVVT